MEAQFLEHYNRELSYLRELGGEFARQYPGVAGRLGMDEVQCSDPFVERLLEGFAFLAARVHRRLDGEFPEFTHSMLESIYPHYTRPIPAAMLVRFFPDKDEGSLVDGYLLPRGTSLLGPTSQHQTTPCRFDTTEDVSLWPLTICETSYVSRDAAYGRDVPDGMVASQARSYLRIVLRTTAGIPLQALALDQLKLQLLGGEVGYRLYEMLTTRACCVAVRGGTSLASDSNAAPQSETTPWCSLKVDQLAAAGFDAASAMLPAEPRSFSGYQLINEYFLLPEKFSAVTITGLQPAIRAAQGNELEILIGFTEHDALLAARLSAEHLALHCVPAVNLFRRRADRVQISPDKFEHQLLVDRSRPLDFEIWSVEQLYGHGETPRDEFDFLPLYAPPNARQATTVGAARRFQNYYTCSRRPRQPSANQRQYGHRSDYLGSELYVALTDSQRGVSQQRVRQLSSTVYCTNRDLALLTPEQGWRDALKMAGAGPVQAIECLTGPTRPRGSMSAGDGQRCWRLINHLTPNHLSFGCGTDRNQDGQVGAAMLREVLALYCQADQPSHSRQVDGILAVKQQAVTRQLPFGGPIVHGRGVEIELTLDDQAFEGGSCVILAAVLEQFLSRFANFNSFTQLALNSPRNGRVFRWPVRLGDVAPL
ncbi:type VI secretion system baseplate subunit TssF [Planctomycetaceae bacterium SH139]